MANGVPNFLQSIVGGYEAGSQQAERSRLQELDQQGRELMGQVARGNTNALAQLAGVNPGLYMQAKQFSDAEKKAFVTDFARSIYDANTPEKYAAVVQRFKSQGHQFDPAEEQFSSRQSMLNQAMDIGDRMGLDLRREESKRAQGNADRSYNLDVQQLAETKRYHDASLAADAEKLKAQYGQFGGPTAMGSETGQPGLTGEDYLKTLPPQIATQVKALSEGRMQFPSGFALKSPYWQQMISAVSQFDPGFDAVNYNSRVQTRKDFTSGKSAQNITSFNTAIAHLGSFKDVVDSLPNGNYPWWNAARNYANRQYDPQTQAVLTKFQATKTAVTEELTRAFRGTGGNVHDIEEWAKAMSAADSPEALHAALNQAVELLRGRIESVGETYQRGMGTTANPMSLLSKKARDTLTKITGEKFDESGNPSAPANADLLIQQANDAIAAGADPAAVHQRLREQGVEADFAQ